MNTLASSMAGGVRATDETTTERPSNAFRAVAIVVLVCLLALLPPLVSLAGWMMGQDYYQHFPVLVVAAIGLAIYRWRTSAEWAWAGEVSPRVLAWMLLTIVATVTVFALPSRWFAAPATILGFVTLIYLAGGRPFFRVMLAPLMLLAAALPLPVRFDQYLVVWLQQVATQLASFWLDLANVLHFTTGTSIETATQGYFVRDACSGINSVFAAVAVGVGYGVVRGYGVRRVLFFLAQLLFWVIFANASRVFLTVYGQSRWGLDLSAPAYHEILGLVTFAVGVLLAISGDHLLRYLAPVAAENRLGGKVDAAVKERADGFWDRSVSPRLAIGLAVALLLMGSTTAVAFFRYDQAATTTLSIEEMAQLTCIDLTKVGGEALPETIGDWRQLDFRSEERGEDSLFGGMISHTWVYGNGRRSVGISLDGPYDDWHDLAVCYGGGGWSVEAMRTIQSDTPEELFACDLRMQREPIDHAQVLYLCVDPQGNDVKPPAYFGGAVMSFVRRFGIGMQDRDGFRGGVIQIQLLDQTPDELDPSRRQENLSLFWGAVERMRSQFDRRAT